MTKYPISAHVQFSMALKYVLNTRWRRRQNSLAAEIGISETMLTGLKKGKKKASVDTQEKIARACGYSRENFMALGRMLHQKIPEHRLPKPSAQFSLSGHQNHVAFSLPAGEDDTDYIKHGGYEGHTTDELTGDAGMSAAVSKLIKIYDGGDDKIIRILNRMLDEFCDNLDGKGR